MFSSSSTSNLYIFIKSLFKFLYNSSNCGYIFLHGPHQIAVKNNNIYCQLFKQLFKMLRVGGSGTPISSLNAKPTDIAMLNIDTRDRETIVILTDSIG